MRLSERMRFRKRKKENERWKKKKKKERLNVTTTKKMSWSEPTNKCHDGCKSQQMRWQRQRQLHSWMIIITVVAFSSSLFAYHEFSRDTGVLFSKYTFLHILTRSTHRTKQPASQSAKAIHFTESMLCE